MRVLVTGHRGYLGSVLTSVLQNAHFEVVGLDCELYRGCEFGRERGEVPSFDIDIRDIEFVDLLSFDAVIHLAGLSDDPSGDLDESLTQEINVEATLRLAECCRQANVSRFIFASTCSVYGRGRGQILDEDSAVDPVTAYSRSKVACEQELARLACPSFMPVCLRLGTLYGVSPALRLDLVLNDFVASAVATGRVVLRSRGDAWRPMLHVEDAARAFAAILLRFEEIEQELIMNVVSPDGNVRVIDLADQVAETVPHCTRLTEGAQSDMRSYRVSGERLARRLSKFRFRWTIQQGIHQLAEAFQAAGLTPGECRSDRYRRMNRLRSLMANKVLDERLRSLHAVAV